MTSLVFTMTYQNETRRPNVERSKHNQSRSEKIKILETRRNFEPYSTHSRTAGANALIGYSKHTTEKPDSDLHIFVWTQADKLNSCDQLFCFEETVDVFSRNALAVKGIKQSFRAIARWHHIAIQWSLLQSSNKLTSID